LPVYLTQPESAPARLVSSKVALGALADSYYEYLLKQWLQSPTETRFKDLWLKAMDELPLLVRPKPKPGHSSVPKYKVVDIGPWGDPIWKMDHLSCFAPGMLALGLRTLPPGDLLHNDRNSTWWRLAEGLTQSCVEMWTASSTGLAPEYVHLNPRAPYGVKEVPHSGRHSFLRPETAESLFYMFRFTGDEKYREWGLQLWHAVRDHGHTVNGYASVQDVNELPTTKVDEMHSFVLAETLKYLYLLFSPSHVLDLDRFILNTEGHPLEKVLLQK